MKPKDAIENIGQIVTIWNSVENKYIEGTFLEYHADTMSGMVRVSKRDIVLPLNKIHLGTVDELDMTQDRSSKASDRNLPTYEDVVTAYYDGKNIDDIKPSKPRWWANKKKPNKNG